ncbi:MAG TPA: hypothetical protein VHD35_10895 [Chitinophagaceae bacterium]|nr:hypothetical protein [Chitinophagaceae bacterium]
MIVQTKRGLKKRTQSTTTPTLEQLKIWVLYPYFETDDPNLKHYYDFSHSLGEFTKVFKELNADWIWQPVTIQDYKEVISAIRKKSKGKTPFVFNICDGDEINNTPGVSVIHELEKHKLLYSGSNAYFYDITSSKIPMKKAFDKAKVSTAKWEIVDGSEESIKGICERLGAPLLIKPAVSGGSMGVSVKNVVHTDEEAIERIRELNQGYRGWQLTTGGLFVEQFIKGPEYTTMIVGSYKHPETCIVYKPVERIFHESLSEEERFLSFDRLWEIYEDEMPMPNGGSFYHYEPCDPELSEKICKLSLDAYCAVKGVGYTRIDIRMDAATKKLYVLEVNAQCGLSEDEDYTSIGAILRFGGKTFTQLVEEIIYDTIANRGITR